MMRECCLAYLHKDCWRQCQGSHNLQGLTCCICHWKRKRDLYPFLSFYLWIVKRIYLAHLPKHFMRNSRSPRYTYNIYNEIQNLDFIESKILKAYKNIFTCALWDSILIFFFSLTSLSKHQKSLKTIFRSKKDTNDSLLSSVQLTNRRKIQNLHVSQTCPTCVH